MATSTTYVGNLEGAREEKFCCYRGGVVATAGAEVTPGAEVFEGGPVA